MTSTSNDLINDNRAICISKSNFKHYYKFRHYHNILESETRFRFFHEDIVTVFHDIDDEIASKLHDTLNHEFARYNYDYMSMKLEEINDAILTNVALNQAVLKIFKHTIKEQYSKLTIDHNCLYFRRFKYIQDYFKLNDLELEILIAQYIYRADDNYTLFVARFADKIKFNDNNIISLDFKARLFNYPYHEVVNSYSANSRLVKFGLLTSNDLQISHELICYIEGFSDAPLEEYYYHTYDGDTLNIDDFLIPQCDKDILLNLLGTEATGKGIRILLYGKPGTGKTEFSRCLARTLNYKTYILNQIDPELSESRHKALHIYENLINDDKSILIIDEAEDLLESGILFSKGNRGICIRSKGLVNTILDESKTIQIWIVNSVDDIDASTLRRFNYSIEFSDLLFSQRKVIWNNLLNKYNYSSLLNDNDVSMISDKYDVNAGPIRNAIENFSLFSKNDTKKDEFLSVINNTLESHIRLTKKEGTSSVNIKNPMFTNYDISGLNIKTNINTTLAILDNFNTLWENGNHSDIRNLNVLLWGPPGTGKTEIAKYIARRIKRTLIIKNASDILSRWVGDTESNIASAFRQAERDKAILFIDEIDGLLSNRQNMKQTWEVTQVNELLVQMENFNGMLICATNNIGIVDSASIRRFTVKLEFDYLTDDGAMHFFNLYFSKILGKRIKNVDELFELKKIKNLTPGDFKITHNKLLLSSNSEISVLDIISELRDEAKIRENNLPKRMGFIA